MKNSTLYLLLGGGLLLLLVKNKSVAQGKVATTNSASVPTWFSDWFKGQPTTKTTPDENQTIKAISGIFGDVLKGLTGGSTSKKSGTPMSVGAGGGGNVTAKSGSPQRNAIDNVSYDNLNTSPVDIYGNEVTGEDLGPVVPDATSYDLGPYDNWGFDATDPFADSFTFGDY